MHFHRGSHCILGPSSRGEGSDLARSLSKALDAPPRPGPPCHTWVGPKWSVHLLCKGKVDLPINFNSSAPSPSEGTVNIISLQTTLGGAGRQFVGGKEWEAARGPGMLIFTGCRPRYLGACTGAKWGLHLQLSSGGGGVGDVSQRETAEIIL